MKLRVYIQDSTLGTGWYTIHVDVNPRTEDQHILDLAHTQNPDATAVRIQREYKLPGRAA
jgi:hypothetical protein